MTRRDPPDTAAPKSRARQKSTATKSSSAKSAEAGFAPAEREALLRAIVGKAEHRMNAKPETLIQLADLGEAQCTADEIASVFGVTPEAFEAWMQKSDRCRLALEHGRNQGRAVLRRAQLRLAQTNASMAIFLGRLYLAQSEREADSVDPVEAAQTAERVREKLAALFAQARQSGSDRDDQGA